MALLAPPARRWLSLRWPREVTADQLLAALAALHGLSVRDRRTPLVLRTIGQRDVIRHRLGLPPGSLQAVGAQLRQAIPGSVVAPTEDEVPLPGSVRVAARLLSRITENAGARSPKMSVF